MVVLILGANFFKIGFQFIDKLFVQYSLKLKELIIHNEIVMMKFDQNNVTFD